MLESIAQAWWRVNERIRKNPCHGIPESIILINFYVNLSILGTFWIIPLKEVSLTELKKKHKTYWISYLKILMLGMLIKGTNPF
jgi:hypothetical protein